MTDSEYDSVAAWVDEGKSLMVDISSGRHGLLVMMAFRLGAWWADRPWRVKK